MSLGLMIMWPFLLKCHYNNAKKCLVICQPPYVIENLFYILKKQTWYKNKNVPNVFKSLVINYGGHFSAISLNLTLNSQIKIFRRAENLCLGILFVFQEKIAFMRKKIEMNMNIFLITPHLHSQLLTVFSMHTSSQCQQKRNCSRSSTKLSLSLYFQNKTILTSVMCSLFSFKTD